MHDELEARIRPNLRPWLVGAVVNLALAAVLVGIPYSRGPERARETLPRFAAFAACFYDAPAAAPAGLGLPRGERARYATLALRAAPDWPERCRDELAAIAPEESLFLFPNVKNAEHQLREAISQLDRELARLAARRAAGEATVSDRPMRGMSQLRAALAELGVSSGVEALSAAHDAISLPDRDGREADLPTPSIIPIRIAIGGPWAIAVEDGALLASAMDSRSVAHARVAEGGVGLRLTRRPRLVTALLGAREPPWVVWSTRAEQCAEEPDGCAGRATGLAALIEDRQQLEPMVWLRAHPAGAPEESIHVQGSLAWVVAVGEGGGVELRRLYLPSPEVRALGEERVIPQGDPEARWAIEGPAPTAVAWLDGDPPLAALAHSGRLTRARASDGEPPSSDAAPEGRVRLAACGDAQAGWIAVGTERGVSLARPSGALIDLDLRLRPPDPRSLLLRCDRGDPDLVDVFALSDGALSRVRCRGVVEGAGRTCGEAEPVVSGVAAFDVARHGAASFVAWTGHADEGAVQLTRIEGDTVATTVPSPCWQDPQDGPCGAPRIASDGATLMLVSRDESDLRVLSSADGERWTPLAGLEQP